MELRERINSLSNSQKKVLTRILNEPGGIDENNNGTTTALIAYFVASHQVQKKELITQLQKSLPDFMIPDTFIQLDKLPKLPNGKIDKSVLPTAQSTSLKTEVIRPSSEMEEVISEIWSDVLGVDEISIHDNFFEIGGDSLLSIAIIARCREVGIHFTPAQFFRFQTINDLVGSLEIARYQRPSNSTQFSLIKIWEKYLQARLIGINDNFFVRGGQYEQFKSMISELEVKFDVTLNPNLIEEPTITCLEEHLEQESSSHKLNRIIPIRTSGHKPPLFCIHSAYFFETVYEDLARNLDEDQPVYGILSLVPELLEQEGIDSIYKLREVYVFMKSELFNPRVPYFLLGWSISNVIAYEAAQLLNKSGQAAALCMMGPPVFSTEDHSFKVPFQEKIRKVMRMLQNPNESAKRDFEQNRRQGS